MQAAARLPIQPLETLTFSSAGCCVVLALRAFGSGGGPIMLKVCSLPPKLLKRVRMMGCG